MTRVADEPVVEVFVFQLALPLTLVEYAPLIFSVVSDEVYDVFAMLLIGLDVSLPLSVKTHVDAAWALPTDARPIAAANSRTRRET